MTFGLSILTPPSVSEAVLSLFSSQCLAAVTYGANGIPLAGPNPKIGESFWERNSTDYRCSAQGTADSGDAALRDGGNDVRRASRTRDSWCWAVGSICWSQWAGTGTSQSSPSRGGRESTACNMASLQRESKIRIGNGASAPFRPASPLSRFGALRTRLAVVAVG